MTNAAALSEDRYSSRIPRQTGRRSLTQRKRRSGQRVMQQQDLEKEFYAAVEKAPEGIRSHSRGKWLLQNSFAVESLQGYYDNDIERWESCHSAPSPVILDAPSDYGL